MKNVIYLVIGTNDTHYELVTWNVVWYRTRQEADEHARALTERAKECSESQPHSPSDVTDDAAYAKYERDLARWRKATTKLLAPYGELYTYVEEQRSIRYYVESVPRGRMLTPIPSDTGAPRDG